MKVKICCQEKKRASDHQLVWIEISSKNLAEKVKKTGKRCTRMFNMEDLEMLCQQEESVVNFKRKIFNILEKVAPMEVKPMEYRGKPKWITKELEIIMKERKLADFKARRSKKMDGEIESRQV